MPNVTWTQHKALRCKLTRMKIANPGALATLLLDAFVNEDGLIPSRCYYKTELEIPGQSYTQWVEGLKKIGILDPFKAESTQKTDWVRFSPGSLIRAYINKEKFAKKELATKDQVPSKSEFEELKARMSKIEEAVRELKSASIPPDNDEKKERRAKATDTLATLALHN